VKLPTRDDALVARLIPIARDYETGDCRHNGWRACRGQALLAPDVLQYENPADFVRHCRAITLGNCARLRRAGRLLVRIAAQELGEAIDI
jgi:hypothetical protein